VCGEEQFGPHHTLLNPTLVVEVLSESTKDYDRNTKFLCYQRIESLQEYIMIEQTERRVYVWTRLAADEWRFREYTEGDIPLSVGANVSMDQIYDLVRFETGSSQ
jgi:Uma2 family endonuclease